MMIKLNQNSMARKTPYPVDLTEEGEEGEKWLHFFIPKAG